MKTFTQLCSSLIAVLLALMGFSCSDSSDNTMAEYGVPSAEFIVKGRVVDSQGEEPIEGIRAMIVNSDGGAYMQSENDMKLTDQEGNFSVHVTMFAHRDVDFTLELEDIDGVENGLYEKKNVEVRFRNAQFSGSTPENRWFFGSTSKDIGDVKIDPVIVLEE